MRILVLANNFPSTTRMPGSPRIFNLCRELAAEHALILALFPRSQLKHELFINDPDNSGVFEDVVFLPLLLGDEPDAAQVSWTRKQLHRAALAPHFSELVRRPDYVKAVRSLISTLIKDRRIDLVLIDRQEMVQYLGAQRGVPIAVDLCDCLALLFRQEAQLTRSPLRRWKLSLEAYSVGRWEERAAGSSALTLVISKPDEAGILRLAPRANTLVVPNGIDVQYFDNNEASPAGADLPPRMVFTGVMAYRPNADAAVHFAADIFPAVRSKMPQAEFWIVGASPPPDVERLRQIPGVSVTGMVEDVRAFLKRADVFVCPLRYGTGMKNKILAALAMRRPVIASPISLSGLETVPGIHLLEAETPQDYVRQLESLRAQPALSESLADSGRRLVLERYSWSTQAAPLNAALKNLQHQFGGR